MLQRNMSKSKSKGPRRKHSAGVEGGDRALASGVGQEPRGYWPKMGLSGSATRIWKVSTPHRRMRFAEMYRERW